MNENESKMSGICGSLFPARNKKDKKGHYNLSCRIVSYNCKGKSQNCEISCSYLIFIFMETSFHRTRLHICLVYQIIYSTLKPVCPFQRSCRQKTRKRCTARQQRSRLELGERGRQQGKRGEVTGVGEVRGRDRSRKPHPSRVLCHHPSSLETDRTAEHDLSVEMKQHTHSHCGNEHQETAVELRALVQILTLQLPALSLIPMIHQSAPS